MSDPQILLTEKCGSLGRLMLYTKDEEKNKIVKSNAADTFTKSILCRLQDLFREIFLPHGYPDSVSEDYLEYQIWDTIQAFCSTITGTFTTQAILKGVGVGDSKATPFAAAITWVVKDGTGMIGRIVFAWWKGNSLDADCKKWRLCADILNDAAMFCELLLPYFGAFSIQILCVTTSMKAIVGVAGAATRASITQHQAIQGNMAEVSAKDGSQETCVNLVASFIGIVLLALVTDPYCEWFIFVFFTLIHLLANYFAVCALNIPYLNVSRLNLVLRTYLRFDTVPNPIMVNQKESVIIGFGKGIKDICGFKIKMADSLHNLPGLVTPYEMNNLVNIYKSNYLLVPNLKKKVIHIALRKGENANDVLLAYFHAIILGIITCYYNQIPVDVHCKRQLRHVTPMARIYSVFKSLEKNSSNREEQLPSDVLKVLNEIVQQEITMFFTALKINGWDLNRHCIEVGEWRSEWKATEIKANFLAMEEHKKRE